MYENKIDLVFIKMLFLKSKSISMQALFHSYFFYQNFGLLMHISIHFLQQTL